jgi:AcrR family transcriptional regulator
MKLEQNESLSRPLRADAERNRRRILAAAAEVFAKRGLDVGLDEIARQAGVGIATVYRRFPDKAELIDALFESRIDDLQELAEKALTTQDPWAGLVHFLERSIEMQQADRGLKELIFGDRGCGAAGSAGTRFAAKMGSLLPAIEALVERAQASGQLRADVSMTDLAVIQFMLHGVGTFAAAVQPDLWRRQFGLLLDGLRADGHTSAPLPLVPLTLDQLEAICVPQHSRHATPRPPTTVTTAATREAD